MSVDIDIEEIFSCPICNSPEVKQISEVSVLQGKTYLAKSFCKTCGSIFANKRPSISWSQNNLYNHDSNIHGDTVKVDISSTIEKRRIQRYENIANFISSFTNKKEILDIGSGTGIGLIGFSNVGFKISGIEPDSRSELLSNYSNIKIIRKDFDEFYKDARSKIPIATIIHVLEHIHKPSDTLRKLGSIIERDGLLYIEVPDVKNFSFSDHAHLAHCNYFNINSLIHLCSRFGFSPVARLFPKTQHFGDVHLGVLFKNKVDKSNKERQLESSSEQVDWYRLSPAFNIRGKQIKIITDSVKLSINDYENYEVFDEIEDKKLIFSKNPRSKMLILFSKFLNDPLEFFSKTKNKFFKLFISDPGFKSFTFSKLNDNPN